MVDGGDSRSTSVLLLKCAQGSQLLKLLPRMFRPLKSTLHSRTSVPPGLGTLDNDVVWNDKTILLTKIVSS